MRSLKPALTLGRVGLLGMTAQYKLAMTNRRMSSTPELETTTEVQEEATGIGAVAGTFGLRGDIFIAQLVNFLIVLVVLWKFAYKPIMRMLEEREAKIAKSVADADAIAVRVADLEREREAVITAARKEAQEVMMTAALQSEERKNEMVEAAKREVERVIQKSKEQMTVEREAMLRDVRKDIVDIAMKAAARIIHTDMDEKKSQSLAEEVVRKMT